MNFGVYVHEVTETSMKRYFVSVDPPSSPENIEQVQKCARQKSPIQVQEMDHSSLDEALVGAPQWAKNLGKLLCGQVEKLSGEFQNMTDSLNHATEVAQNAEKTAKEAKLEVERLRTVCETLRQENNKLADKMVYLESQSRRNNLIFSGVPEVRGETEQDLRTWLVNFLENVLDFDNGSSMQVERIHRLGPHATGQIKRNRDIIVKWHSYVTRQQVWDRRSKLRKQVNNTVYVSEDYPQEITSRRQRLRPIMQAAIRSGSRATISVDRLLIDGALYTVDTLYKLPDHLKPETLSVQKEGNYTFFFGRDCPLSNFYSSPFFYNGYHYNCGEQYLQHQKAKAFGDEVTAGKIMTTENPQVQKSLGKQVVGFNKKEWTDAAPQLIQPGIAQKFAQNEKLKDVLLKTGDTILVECSASDHFWGIGLSMKDKQRADVNSWQGANHMGKILTEVRSSLQ